MYTIAMLLYNCNHAFKRAHFYTISFARFSRTDNNKKHVDINESFAR
ncbi:hypothetical protein AGNV_058 [Anticarsia gemmatalis multiple nucleopolyhedrovirus]|uniref:Uncharacterized protein n=1 Tax=Anticarsia gemmatalis multiple nucleopolyhedrovirus TaxID=268591 RepID=A0A0S3IY24_9ABAC|nr:hypothetical protein AGNV_058 [Anticarsia gemmatalis nucleopolyhedrovirus]YP_009316075.1 hypothetical protein AGNV_058 [Anticarsia gemmatalis multiple nucleopolyhedrovirus]AKJ32600.1 hypothetical protein AGNV_058 [Anticarsia gemmatalis multiple nucleopolyhedrovirus]ALR69865.1 hypothetical protein AGNV_058 [Anticarsia gemmatalis multiple nucleopolyhedrovirus]ALR70023.1 hypothetical protein AGNV_058 [Anticarsia gemmatalis multiple nucleopolyhedrovirus]ALR70180.1 hypothetical protein AGNV_058 